MTINDDSLIETITFINEDIIRYKYYYHGNGKWKANRCKIIRIENYMYGKLIACHEHFYKPKKRVILLFYFGYIWPQMEMEM